MSVLPKRKSRKVILPPIPNVLPKELHLNKEPKIGVYAGSFDPVHNGHLDVINKAAAMFDELYIIVATNISKRPLLSLGERMDLIIAQNLPDNTKVISAINNMLTVDQCKVVNAKFLIRGVRNIIDFEYELAMSQFNHNLSPEVQTVFIPTTIENAIISSSAIKEIAKFKGEICNYVPDNVAERIDIRLRSEQNG